MPQEQTHPREDLFCPICRGTMVFYGRQNYPVEDRKVPSYMYRCALCDFNWRRFDKPLHEVLSHFKVAPYSSDEIEQKWFRRREGFYYYLLDLLEGPAEGRSLLDIGCAFGHFLDCAVQRGYRPFGTEVSEEMAELTRQRKSYPVSTHPLDDPQMSEERFDVITFVDSFYYFEYPLETLQACRRLLKPGGQLLMRVTNRNQMARAHQLASAWRTKSGDVPEMPFWTTDDAISCHSRKSVKKLMEKTGLRIAHLSCLEKGKKIESFGLRSFYAATGLLARLSGERICWTPGVVCVAKAD